MFSRIRKKFANWVFVLPTIILLFLVLGIPLLYSFYTSLLNESSNFVGFSNYRELFLDARFKNSFIVSLIFTLAAVFIEFILGFALAVVIDKFISAKNFLVSILFLPMMVTPVVVGSVWRMFYHPSAGVINWFLSLIGIEGPLWLASTKWSLPALIMTDVWQWTPFMFMILLAGLQSLPIEPYEAAKVDGATEWQILRLVTLPLMVPVMLVAILIRFLEAIKIFDQVFVLTHGGPGSSTETLSFYIYKVGFMYSDMGYASALSYIFTITIIILSFLLVRLISRGSFETMEEIV